MHSQMMRNQRFFRSYSNSEDMKMKKNQVCVCVCRAVYV